MQGTGDIELVDNGKAAREETEAPLTDLTSATNWKDILEAAIRGEAVERTLTWQEALGPYARSIFWSFGISLCIVMQGYDLALVGSLVALPVFREKYGTYSGHPSTGYQLDPAWQSALGQAGNIGMFFGAAISSVFLPRVGHKRVLQVALISTVAFIFIVFFAPTIQILFAGEILCGLPWGTFAITVVSYASEVAPVALRGYFTTYVNAGVVIGQLIAAGLIVGVQKRTDQWAFRIPFAVQWVWPLPLLILVTLAPESPWFLVRQNRTADAEKAIRRLNTRIDAEQAANAVALMMRTNRHEIDVDPRTGFLDCFRGSDLRRTEIAIMGFAMQYLSGTAINGSYFFEQAGLNPANAFKLNLGSTAMGLCGTFLAWFSLTHFGRRKIFLVGLLDAFILLFLVGILAIPSRAGNSGAKWGQAVLMFLWNFNYQSTLGPIGYSILAETSSTRLRAMTVTIARNNHSIVSVVTGIIGTYQLNPTAWNWKGFSAFFWSGTCFLSLIWTYFRLPEFKGRTYRELDILFENMVPARKFKSTQVDLVAEDIAS